MKTSANLELVFYQEIGQLFYAIAASDKIVRNAEYKAMQKLIKEEWISLDDYKDEFGVDAAYQIEIVFDWFDYENLDAEVCFQAFANFYSHHKTLFTTKRKKLIWKTANSIAAAFSGKNKSEVIMLSRLMLLFQNEK